MRRDVLVEARLIRDLRVARRQVEQAALLAALRHDEPHPASGLRRQPAFEHLGLGVAERDRAGGSPAAPADRRRTAAAPPGGRRTPRVRLGAVAGPASSARRPAPVTSSTRSTTLPPRIWKTCTTAPAGPTFRPKASRSPSSAPAIFCCRVRSVSIVRIASRSCAACSKRSVGGRLRHPLAQRLRRSSSLRPSRKSFVCCTATRYSLLGADLADAGRDAALDVVLEARPRPRSPVIASLHDRMPNSLCVSDIVRRPSDAGMNGPGVEVVVALDAARDQHPRKRLARRQLQVGIVLVVAQQDVVFRRPLLDQVVLERQRLDRPSR